MQAVVLAGGLGTRLRSVLGEVPKVLAPVNGVPWLGWVLRGLQYAGFTDVCIATGFRRELVKQAIDAKSFGPMAIRYSEEDQPLGTGGALRKALTGLHAEPTFALNGDTWLDVPWRSMLDDFVSSGACMSIAIRQVPDRQRYGAVEIADGRVVAFGEKEKRGPGYINGGVYLVNSCAFDATTLPDRFSLETDFIQPSVSRVAIRGFVVDGPFLDIGVPTDLAHASDFVRTHMSFEETDVHKR